MSDAPASILVVDDDEDALQLLTIVLERSGYHVYSAMDGLTALSLAEGHWREIEAIILDLMMPGELDGYAVCDRLKENPHTARTPIIVLSAKSSARDMMRSYEVGAFQHITKPYDIQYLVAVVASMVSYRRMERAAVRNAEKYHTILDNAPMETLLLSPDLHILEMNAVMREAFPEAKVGDALVDACYDETPPDMDQHPVVQSLREGTPKNAIIQCRRKGRDCYLRVSAAPLKDEEGAVVSIIRLSEDVTERRELEEQLRSQIERHSRALQQQDLISERLMNVQRQLRQKSQELEEANRELERLSITDPLTDLYNRRHFDDVFGHESRRAERYNHHLSVLMMDIDHFKDINDDNGHAVGDEVLRSLADLLRSHVRETDTVARWGGEEFVALLPETDLDTALEIGERLRQAIGDREYVCGDVTVRITISIGVAARSLDEDAAEKRDVLTLADEALYEAKDKGRDRVVSASQPNLRESG